ncbi:FAD-dependent oxidoreductase [Qipengyuania sp. MTN3-11]|uniref:FAD-dependent oxidoreductase n=1 Tax=Qipengyuania sp. MTN3-11 TaxID=3056557 RepID=UPI0036F42233
MALDRPAIVLIGAGHAHLGVIDDWLRHGPPDAHTVLVEPRDAMQYSGMVPGWLAGEYRQHETRIALAPLVAAAGIEWHRFPATGIDPERRTIMLATGDTIAFDLCSIASGGAPRAARVLGSDPRLLDIRPINRFVERWNELRTHGPFPRRIAVIGGGAGGVELAFGLRNSVHAPEVELIAGKDGLLPDHSARVRRKVRGELDLQGIALHSVDARIVDGRLMAGPEPLDPPDLIVAAIGSGAAEWPGTCGLPVDRDGFIRVGPTLAVEGMAHIFAAGDVARRTDREVRHSGVHAVYAGPVLARNLRRRVAGERRLAAYDPRGMDIYLLNTCRGESILSYGPLALQGRWLRRLKDWLDRRWIARFSGRGDPRSRR